MSGLTLPGAVAEELMAHARAELPNEKGVLKPGMFMTAKISAPAAWNITTGSTAVTVGGVDTGI